MKEKNYLDEAQSAVHSSVDSPADRLYDVTCAILALVQEQRETNRLLTAALRLARDAIMFDGDVSGLDDVLGQFIQHPRDPSLEVG